MLRLYCVYTITEWFALAYCKRGIAFLRILQWWGKTAKGPIFLPLAPPRLICRHRRFEPSAACWHESAWVFFNLGVSNSISSSFKNISAFQDKVLIVKFVINWTPNIQTQHKFKYAHQQILNISSIIFITKIYCNSRYLVTYVILVTFHAMSIKRYTVNY